MKNVNDKELYIGIKLRGHDSAIFVIDLEEKLIFAMSTERLTRFKHDDLFPLKPLLKYIEYNHINPNHVKKIYLGDSFLRHKTERILSNWYEFYLISRQFLRTKYAMDYRREKKLFNNSNIIKKAIKILKSKYGLKILWIVLKRLRFRPKFSSKVLKDHLKKLFPNAEILLTHYDHHYCHAISSFYFCPWEKALLITIDGVGDKYFSKVYLANKGKIDLIASSQRISIDINKNSQKSKKNKKSEFAEEMPYNSCTIGIIYSYLTLLLGFQPLSGEGKVEALAAYGNWNNKIYNKLDSIALVNEKERSIDINKIEAENFLNLKNMKKILQKYKKEDVASALQKFLEKKMLKYIKLLVEYTQVSNICLSGGVAANVILNMHIYENISKNIYIVPAMGDEGSAQGAAILRLLDNGYTYKELKWLNTQYMPYFGNSYSKQEVCNQITKFKGKISLEDLGNDWPEKVAELIVNGEIGAIFQGRMEWGPRALGNRSILADPRSPESRDKINHFIKERPHFQPFCPSILTEEKDIFFDSAYENKHMTCAFRMKEEFKKIFPGAIHVDGTSRVQFVDEKDNLNYYRLLKKVKALTGYGIVINTSFNKHGRTIVESPHDAIVDFLDSHMDFVAIEGILIRRKNK